MASAQVLLQRCVDEKGRGLIAMYSLDSTVTVVDMNSNAVKPVRIEGVWYIPCGVGDRILIEYKNKNMVRMFKVVDIERSEQFFVCDRLYTNEETVEMELLSIASQVEAGTMTTNKAHLKADQLLLTVLFDKGLDAIADAFNKIPKYYE